MPSSFSRSKKNGIEGEESWREKEKEGGRVGMGKKEMLRDRRNERVVRGGNRDGEEVLEGRDVCRDVSHWNKSRPILPQAL